MQVTRSIVAGDRRRELVGHPGHEAAVGDGRVDLGDREVGDVDAPGVDPPLVQRLDQEPDRAPHVEHPLRGQLLDDAIGEGVEDVEPLFGAAVGRRTTIVGVVVAPELDRGRARLHHGLRLQHGVNGSARPL